MRCVRLGASLRTEHALPLGEGWTLAATAPGAAATPADLPNLALDWKAATVPGTAAQALSEAGMWDFDIPRDFDASDWWYRCSFIAESSDFTSRCLQFDGLATLADVWLNGTCVLRSDNMFRRYEIDVGAQLLEGVNELAICFRSLNAALGERRPRPRWKTKLISHQQLRWFRTTLLGRIPGWSPPVAAVGPWRPVVLDVKPAVAPFDISLHTSLAGNAGVVDFRCRLQDAHATRARLRIGDVSVDGRIERVGDGTLLIEARTVLDGVTPWWPHTHGEPALYSCSVELETAFGTATLDCGRVGFRDIAVNRDGNGFALHINGARVFCRGACWTAQDIVTLAGRGDELARTLELAKAAGMNMIRVGGTMLYESDEFYALCDELGLLVWQDFMFANMDYPVDDERFRASVMEEAEQQLRRLQAHPCITVYCGNSEVEQQAAMLGMAREHWRNALFAQWLPELCAREHPGVPYVPSTPSGGVLPFHVGQGLCHYYGVGAYMRPIAEVRRANVRFTAECLGFANVPEPSTVYALTEGQAPVMHHPRWKGRVPRDTSAGWDFEDVRDHYLRALYAVDPVQLRSFDMERYLALSRVVSGEVMAQVYAEWRSAHSACGGALVWFFKDLWPGAGWGIVDSRGVPKAAYYALRRVWQPLTVTVTDEGLDGLHAHVVNDTGFAFEGVCEFCLYRDGKVLVAKAERQVSVAQRSVHSVSMDEVLGGFFDVTYAYRFGPSKHDVTVITLRDGLGEVIGEAFHFPQPGVPRATDVVPTAQAERSGPDSFKLVLHSERFLYGVRFDVEGYAPDDNYFHLAPGRERVVTLRCCEPHAGNLRGMVEAINLAEPVKINITKQ